MFFDNWFAVWRILIVGLAAYFALILVLRISGSGFLGMGQTENSHCDFKHRG